MEMVRHKQPSSLARGMVLLALHCGAVIAGLFVGVFVVNCGILYWYGPYVVQQEPETIRELSDHCRPGMQALAESIGRVPKLVEIGWRKDRRFPILKPLGWTP